VNLIAIKALIRNDLRLYRSDRRAVVVGILMPILIAAFFGYLFRQNTSDEASGKVPIALVDEDGSAVTRAIITQISGDSMLQVTPLTRQVAREQVRKGTQQAAAVFPKGFGEQSVGALFTGRNKPRVELFVDPSQAMSSKLVQGLLAQYSMQEISKEAFNGPMGKQNLDRLITQLDTQPASEQRRDLMEVLQAARRLNELQENSAAGDGSGNQPAFSIPYEVAATSVTASAGTPYNSFAHSFAGMSVQFILMAGVDAGILLLLLRQRGLWQRIRAAPLGRGEFILARMISTAMVSAFQVAVIYLVAMVVFGVRIEGSLAGFLFVAAAFCVLNAAFGLMLATLGRSASATRGVAIMVMLLLVMMGGAWVPTFVFPQWLQTAAHYTPTYWAVTGLDAMTWRGLPFTESLLPAAILCGTALLCMVIALWRFRWEE
jgi:ABC-2 type transport system permease protein